LQGATNLLPTISWTPLATHLADTNGLFQFTDTHPPTASAFTA
jgi:hypothetical protein